MGLLESLNIGALNGKILKTDISAHSLCYARGRHPTRMFFHIH